MGRVIRSMRVGTKENISALELNLTKINGAEVYWSDEGDVCIVASEDWSEYLLGKRDDMPLEPLIEGAEVDADCWNKIIYREHKEE